MQIQPEMSKMAMENGSGELAAHLAHLGLELGGDDFIVWQKDNIAHPRNWPVKRKAFDIGLVILFDLFAFVPTKLMSCDIVEANEWFL